MKLIAVVALLVIVATPLVRGQSKARQGGRPIGTAEEEIGDFIWRWFRPNSQAT